MMKIPVITMTIPEIREFSLAYEVERLGKMLMLPITHIVFDERYKYGKLYLNDDGTLATIYAKLYVNEDLIGTIPYISDRWGPGYDTSKQKELAWEKIYQQFQQEIFAKIVQQEPFAVTAQIKEYRSLSIKDKDGTIINTAFCNYIDNEWKVILKGLNPVVIRKEFKIVISPPTV